MANILLGDIRIEVIRKHIKNINLSIHPPGGRVRISAPVHMELETIRNFARSKLGWIKKHQTRMQSQERVPPLEFSSGENHLYLGNSYSLRLKGRQPAAGVCLKSNSIEVYMRGPASPAKAKTVLQNWYRARLREMGREYIKKWEPLLGVTVRELGIKLMKTRWGTCNARAKRIWLNLELIKEPRDCIEYLVVHEMAHLLVRGHGSDFKKLMDLNVPDWKRYRRRLNKIPQRHGKREE